MLFPRLSESERVKLLEAPVGKVRVVLDSDTYNEVDDQFALSYALAAEDKLDIEAVYAAPFHNNRSDSPGDGMEKSYTEIEKILSLFSRLSEGFAYRGSDHYLESADSPVSSPAALDLAERASKADLGPLYVAAIGAITNVASAILINPEIIRNIVVVWLGGHAPYWPHTREFNLMQDYHASRLIFDCGLALVQMPCLPVASHLLTTVHELEAELKDTGGIGDYLLSTFKDGMKGRGGPAKEIWDLSAIAYLCKPELTESVLVPSPVLNQELRWSRDERRHLIRIATRIDRNGVFRDFFAKLKSR